MAYLDDLSIGDEASRVAENLLALEEKAADLGMVLNRNKCEVISHTTAAVAKLESYGITLPVTEMDTCCMLGSPIEPGQRLREIITEKKADLQLMASRLKYMPAHDGLYLLSKAISSNRLLYLLRTAPYYCVPELATYDAELREITAALLNINMTESRWDQASLPVRWGGIGIRGAALLAPSAFLASAAGASELIPQILPGHTPFKLDDYSRKAVEAWKTRAGEDTLTSKGVGQQRQGLWDEPCCKKSWENLLSSAPDDANRARLLAAAAEHSGDWMNAVPITAIGLKLVDDAVRIAVGLRLGASLTLPHACRCAAEVLADGHHGLSCRRGNGMHARHDMVNEVLRRALASAAIPSVREPKGLFPVDGKRLDGASTVPWSRGKCVGWDVTCPDTFASSHIGLSSVQAGALAKQAESKKTDKYRDIAPTTLFVPVALETTGVWGPEGLRFVRDIGRKIAITSKDKRSTTFLLQRLSITLQRGNATCVQAANQRASLSEESP